MYFTIQLFRTASHILVLLPVQSYYLAPQKRHPLSCHGIWQKSLRSQFPVSGFDPCRDIPPPGRCLRNGVPAGWRQCPWCRFPLTQMVPFSFSLSRQAASHSRLKALTLSGVPPLSHSPLSTHTTRPLCTLMPPLERK